MITFRQWLMEMGTDSGMVAAFKAPVMPMVRRGWKPKKMAAEPMPDPSKFDLRIDPNEKIPTRKCCK